YAFGDMIGEELDFLKAFQKRVPVHTYNEMYAHWWHRAQKGEADVTWPGKIKYFALSSGTSESASKHIPVTQVMIRAIKNIGFRQLYSMVNFDVPPVAFGKGILMLGGTTSLFEKGEAYEGDMSGISATNMPRRVSSLLYKPGQKISRRADWDEGFRLIVENVKYWDVGTVCGVPAWVQIVIEQIFKRYKARTIHDIWP